MRITALIIVLVALFGLGLERLSVSETLNSIIDQARGHYALAAPQLFSQLLWLGFYKTAYTYKWIAALVFSGWPGLSFGTYGGEIAAFDKARGTDQR